MCGPTDYVFSEYVVLQTTMFRKRSISEMLCLAILCKHVKHNKQVVLQTTHIYMGNFVMLCLADNPCFIEDMHTHTSKEFITDWGSTPCFIEDMQAWVAFSDKLHLPSRRNTHMCVAGCNRGPDTGGSFILLGSYPSYSWLLLLILLTLAYEGFLLRTQHF